MNEADLKHEIETIINEREAEGAACPTSWVVTSTINKLGDANASPFHRLTASIGVLYLVRKVLQGRKKIEDDEGRQGEMFPAYVRLQRSYTITRPGEDGKPEQVIVPLSQMTYDELMAKAAEKDALSEGNRQHAAELRDYAAALGRAVA